MGRFWDLVTAEGGQIRTARRRYRMEQMNMWRNAIAHDSFEQYQSKSAQFDNLHRVDLRWWREAGRALPSETSALEACPAPA